ncbi:MAG TPA: carboxypeptidase-like regulatory domain-containing protein [Paludibacteraceae bacterium]|nr:carboxypeptidase-like regulatory domain-containing protein [Paludibacteraceae bacterium]
MRYKIIFILFFLLSVASVFAQGQKVRIYGYVIDENNRGIEDAGVRFEGMNNGTSTNRNGYYDLYVNITDSVKIVYSHLGYETIRHTIFPGKQVVQITVALQALSRELKTVDVTVNRRSTSNMQTLEAEKYKLMPNASGSFESLLISFAGVTSNNELSSQYNVRGGNFDENIVYVNGTEIYRPLLIRAGQQEGLSFINPDMVGNVAFSSGGFNAEFGDKMSSVLDVKYKKPISFEASGAISLLGASAYLGTAGNRFTQMHGIRYKTSKYLLGTLDTKGSYKPDFIDYQTYLTYQISPRVEINFLGNFSRNNYTFIPDSQSTAFGTFNMAEKLNVYYEGQEKDLFQTAFGALSLLFRPKENLKLSITTSTFSTNENETYDITGNYVLGELKMGDTGETEEGEKLGVGTYHEHARNRLKATVANISHSGEYIRSGHTLKWGVNLQREIISDKINEWEWRDSAGYSMPYTDDKVVDLFYNMKSTQKLDSRRTSAYIQDTYRWDTEHALYALTGGLRASHWSYNREFLLSPRASVSILPHWDKDFNFRLATGLYYQSPFYKELRDTVSDALGNVTVHLNPNLKAQRSLHLVLGGDHYFRWLGRPFKFTTEAYLKLADRVTTYSVDNVRIRYSGQNDAKAYTAGVDFKLFGELVPGTDSWINFSLMRSREDVLNDFYTDKEGNKVYPGWISRPNEARYSLSMLLSDYLPNNPKYKLYLKTIFSDGLPVGPPRSPRYMADRFRLRDYKRVDIGASRVIVNGSDRIMNKRWMKNIASIWLNLEVFNLFDFKNENSIYWVSDIYGYQHGSPNYLTGRQFNLKLMVDIK